MARLFERSFQPEEISRAVDQSLCLCDTDYEADAQHALP